MDIKERDIGIDLVRIFACIGIVAMHTIKAKLGIVNQGLLLTAFLCVPIFFLINGYLMFKKEKISYEYVLKKIGRILGVCFAWEFLHAMVYFAYYREMRNFLSSYILDFVQEGLFYHFWFMGALILVYMVMPYLHYLARKTCRGFLFLMCILGSICIALNYIKSELLFSIPQTLQVWYWLFYFMVGGFISINKDRMFRLKKTTSKQKIIMFLFLIGISIAGQKNASNSNYGLPVIMFVAIGIFVIGINVSVSNKISSIIAEIASLTMGIYIFHPFILSICLKFVPEFIEFAGLNIVYWIIVIDVCLIISYIISKIPFMKDLIKL